MTFSTDGLSADQIKQLPVLGRVTSRLGYYLAGGTALTAYFAHRRSLDLDFFSRQPLEDPLQLAQILRDDGIGFNTLQTAPGILHGSLGCIRTSFFEYRYPLLQPPEGWAEMGCDLASLDDLACMKLAAIAQRGSRKDFVHIHALISRHRPLVELLSLYQKKFSVQDISPVLYGLPYFEDADLEPGL